MFERKISKRKSGRTLLTIVLALALCLGSFTAVFAADVSSGTEGNSAKAAITKILKMPKGTTIPENGFTFTFDIDPVKVDGVAAAIAGNMPAITDGTVTFTKSDSGDDAADVTTYTKESSDIFSGVTFPHPGVYIYEITEQQTGAFTPTSGWTENMVYSKAKYTVTIVVKKGTSASFIETIAVDVEKKDDGTDGKGKVDPTPGTGKGMVFTNTYTKTQNQPDPAQNSSLNIGMTAAGDYADPNQYFPVDVTVTKSALDTNTSSTYKAYVLGAGNSYDTSSDNYAGIESNGGYDGKPYINLASDQKYTINLKHDQRLVVMDTPVGTAWTAVDKLDSDPPLNNYIASGTINSVTIGTATGSKGDALSTGDQKVLETGSIAAFTNTYDITSPTGIIINNLPYIGLIVLALGALAVFIAFKSRKRGRTYN
ncbi:MAG: hypothetical protein LBL36_06125 [Clostridiales Family XIII bacterium]|jgi:hypothetical protein|nr:hypothetical protein [Clostridiales Family XIII bacterium]